MTLQEEIADVAGRLEVLSDDPGETTMQGALVLRKAAALLRRLGEREGRLRTALTNCLTEMRGASDLLDFMPDDYGEAMNEARAALDEAGTP